MANVAVDALNDLHRSYASADPPNHVQHQHLHNQPQQNHSSHLRSIHASGSLSQQRMLARIIRCCARQLRTSAASRPSSERDGHQPLGDVLRHFLPYLPHLSAASFDQVPDAALPPLFSYAPAKLKQVPLKASSVSLPDVAGTADLLHLLPPDVAANYVAPSTAALLQLPIVPAERPRLRLPFRTSRAEYVALLRRMHAAGMLSFTTKPAVVNSIFTVPKGNDGAQRLIIDARPANLLFHPSPDVRLPTPDLLARLDAPADQPFYVAKTDLSDFYHALRLPEWMHPFFALPPVNAADLGLPDAGRVFPCCATLPMGFSHSVFLAQAAHEHLIRTRTSWLWRNRVALDTDTKLDRMRYAIYIDDVILVGPHEDELLASQDEYAAAVGREHLLLKPSKRVRPTKNPVDCLGLCVDGVEHTIGLSPDKGRALINETYALLATGACTGTEMAALVGSWTWACLVARPSLSAMSAVYRFIESAGTRRWPIWSSCVTELRTLVGLMPLLFAKLSTPWFPRTICTDASTTGQGVVASNLPPERMLRYLDYEGSSAAQQAHWYTLVSSPWRRAEHINVLELRALSTALRWALSHPTATDKRLLLLTDSTVCAGVLTKGRSSSLPLLRRFRSMAASSLAAGVRLCARWIPTNHNPADVASRAYQDS
jgi:hypothetical protein